MKKGGLGRGLSALIPGAAEEIGLLEVPVAAVDANPRQPRTTFNDDSLAALARSIQEVGVLQPIVVRRLDEGYELVAGERRLRAARLAGLSTVPAVIRQGDDADSLRDALIENIHREQLGPIELAEAFRELLEDLGASQEALAQRLGISRPHVANTLRLLQLPPRIQELLAERRLHAGHARALLTIPDGEAQLSLALRAAAEDLSVRQVEELARTYSELSPSTAESAPKVRTTVPDPETAEVEEILSEHLETRVSIRGAKRRGKITIEFGSAEDLERIVSRIIGEPAAAVSGNGSSNGRARK